MSVRSNGATRQPPSSPLVKLGISWLVVMQRTTDGGIGRRSAGLVLWELEVMFGVWLTVRTALVERIGLRLPTDDSQQIWGNEERSHGSLASGVDLTLGRKQRIVVAVSLTFLPAHPPRKRRNWGLGDGIRPSGLVESMEPRSLIYWS
jgi:hypothetical protein